MNWRRYSKAIAVLPSAICSVLVAGGWITDAQSVQITTGLSAILGVALVYFAPPNEVAS